ncbi:hypothetical protein [Streptomyces albipurpureus]|uniref:Uncharacterized protein n=1 Tax=Streptomyces albipurpureus TaxID=2897419 RepID=A0ABT0UUC2_9ACTN|nr:hypothetical protein [Streptomyces sp. CWNU-1]MCM2391569.1 hypothetical protein [Streptomyces sp. CWNU-1]
MSAHSPTPSPVEGGAGVRLPWWSLALPMLAFVFLLLLIADPAQAQPAEETTAIGDLVAYIQLLLFR